MNIMRVGLLIALPLTTKLHVKSQFLPASKNTGIGDMHVRL